MLEFFTAKFFQMMLIPGPQPQPGLVEPIPMSHPDSLPESNDLRWILQGSYQFVLRGEYVTTEILVPLRYKFKNRKMTSLPCEPSAENWHLIPAQIFPGIELKT